MKKYNNSVLTFLIVILPLNLCAAELTFENAIAELQKGNAGAVQQLEELANKGDQRAQNALVLVYRDMLKNENKAFYWAKKAAVNNDPAMQYVLAHMYAGGNGTVQNYEKALALFHDSADRGYAFSQFELGGIYEHGKLGTTKNINTALIWYQKSADQKIKPAIKSLTYLRKLKNYMDVAEKGGTTEQINELYLAALDSLDYGYSFFVVFNEKFCQNQTENTSVCEKFFLYNSKDVEQLAVSYFKETISLQAAIEIIQFYSSPIGKLIREKLQMLPTGTRTANLTVHENKYYLPFNKSSAGKALNAFISDKLVFNKLSDSIILELKTN